jgi:hypothetical protein
MKPHDWHLVSPLSPPCEFNENRYECSVCRSWIDSHTYPTIPPSGLAGQLVIIKGNPPRPVRSDMPADCDLIIVKEVMES